MLNDLAIVIQQTYGDGTANQICVLDTGGKFVLLAAIALPGGAEGYAPNKSIGFTGNTSYNFAPQTAKTSDPKDQPR